MGYWIRTSSHRYTRWIDWKTRQPFAEELYHYTHTGSVWRHRGKLLERMNLVDQPASRVWAEALRETMDRILIERSQPMVPAEIREHPIRSDR